MVPQKYKPVIHLATNKEGKDYVIGDIHGCFDDFNKILELLKFDKAKDRMFSVGDLVDRGPSSIECAHLIYEPWFYCVRANHEDMMIKGLLHHDNLQFDSWISNGGAWYYRNTFEKWRVNDVAKDLDMMPYIYVIGKQSKRFHVVHAEVVKYDQQMKRIAVTNQMITKFAFDDYEQEQLIWGRTMITNGTECASELRPNQFRHNMDQMSLTFVGHTPTVEPVRIQQQVYLDGGMVYGRNSKTGTQEPCVRIAQPLADLLHIYAPFNESITETIKISDLTIRG